MKTTSQFWLTIEVLIATMLLLPQLFMGFCIIISWFRPEETKVLIKEFFEIPCLPFITIITCIILALWIIWGNGVNSKLWSWLPPFVFFKKMGSFGKALVVGLLIFGTLLGMIGEYTGLLDPAF